MIKPKLFPIFCFLMASALIIACGESANPESGVFTEPSPETSASAPQKTPRFTFRIVHRYPHDRQAFTQGLAYFEGHLYEGTGLNGSSSLRLVELETGEVVRIHYLPERYFGEGIALYKDSIIQLTWQSNLGFVYDRKSFKQLREFPYSTEGWGITYDGERLIVSDGSANLYFWDPDTLRETGRIEVRDRGKPVLELNELEYVRGEIFANVWKEDTIARIDPASGNVTGWIDLEGLRAYIDPGQSAEVLNGIAYDAENGRLFVTGKWWPNLFEITLVPSD
jgi:glutamine cyclotransferase